MAPYLNRRYQSKIPTLIDRLHGSNQGAIDRHMSSLMGGQKSLLDDYVKRAAGAGVQRGGMNVVGGAPLQSRLALEATRGLAGQYAQNYSQATQNANQDRASDQQLLSQLMNASTDSGGYGSGSWGTGRSTGAAQNRGLSGEERRARATNQEYADRIARRAMNDASHDWRMNRANEKRTLMQQRQQQNWQAQDRRQQIADAKTQRHRDDLAWEQGQQDRAQQLKDQKVTRDAAYRDRQYALSQQNVAQNQAARQGMLDQQTHRNPTRLPGTNTMAPSMATKTSNPETSEGRELSEFQQNYQKQQMLNELERQAQQTRQSKLQTQSQALQLSGERYKQNAWMRAQNPYVQSMNAFLGLGGLGYGGMNNARLGQARIAADVWAGLTRPSNRSFSWSNSTSVSGPRNSYKG
jgi:hypothetical protein